MNDSRKLEFYRELAKNRLKSIENILPAIKYKLYTRIVETCEDVDRIKSISDIGMQDELIGYVETLQKDLESTGTTMTELEALCNGSYSLNNVNSEEQELNVDSNTEAAESLINNYEEQLRIINALTLLEVDSDKEDYGVELDRVLDEDISMYDEEDDDEDVEDMDRNEDIIIVDTSDNNEEEEIILKDIGVAYDTEDNEEEDEEEDEEEEEEEEIILDDENMDNIEIEGDLSEIETSEECSMQAYFDELGMEEPDIDMDFEDDDDEEIFASDINETYSDDDVDSDEDDDEIFAGDSGDRNEDEIKLDDEDSDDDELWIKDDGKHIDEFRAYESAMDIFEEDLEDDEELESEDEFEEYSDDCSDDDEELWSEESELEDNDDEYIDNTEDDDNYSVIHSKESQIAKDTIAKASKVQSDSSNRDRVFSNTDRGNKAQIAYDILNRGIDSIGKKKKKNYFKK